MTPIDFPTWLREALAANGHTAYSLAKEIGVARKPINRYLNGETTPTLRSVRPLIEPMDVDTSGAWLALCLLCEAGDPGASAAIATMDAAGLAECERRAAAAVLLGVV